jgi:hypothetical protein
MMTVFMPISDILTAMIDERDRLSKAIEALGGSSTRGTGVSHTPKVTQSWSVAKRKAASERMRKYWQAKRRKRAAATKKA